MIKNYVKKRTTNNKKNQPFLWPKQPQKKTITKSNKVTATLQDQDQKQRTGRESTKRALNLVRRSGPMEAKIGIRQ